MTTDKSPLPHPESANEPKSLFQKIFARPWWGLTVFVFGMSLLLMGIFAGLAVLGGQPVNPPDEELRVEQLFIVLLLLCALPMSGLALLREVLRIAGFPVRESQGKVWVKRGGLALGIGLLLFTVALVVESVQELPKAAGNERTLIRFADQQFQLAVTNDWEVQPIAGDQFVTVYGTQASIGASFAATGGYLSDLVEADQNLITETMTNQINSTFDASSIQSSESFTDRNVNVTDRMIEGTSGSVKTTVWLRVVTTDTMWAEVRIAAAPSAFTRHRETFAAIMQSVQQME